MQDYGGPVGLRMALAHPERRIDALIVQNAVAHNEGLGAIWKTRRAFWADRVANERALRTNLLSLPTTRTRHVGNDPNVELYDPDLWTDEFAFLNQPGQADIQSDLYYERSSSYGSAGSAPGGPYQINGAGDIVTATVARQASKQQLAVCTPLGQHDLCNVAD